MMSPSQEQIAPGARATASVRPSAIAKGSHPLAFAAVIETAAVG
jgi:hypothetical protein